MSRLAHQLIRLNTRVAGMPGSVTLARKLRNQCDLLIANALTGGRNPDIRTNGELWLLERVAPVETFVDVGANVGEWSGHVLRLSPGARGIAFEPLAELADRIAGVEVVRAAVSDETSPPELAFYRHERFSAWSSLLADWSGEKASSRRTVPVTTLDAELTRRGIAAVDVLKVDAEGYDLHVLRGARRLLSARAFGVVQFEYSHAWALARSTLAEALNLLEGCGYRTYLLTGRGLLGFDYPRYGEFFAYSNFVAVSPDLEDRVAAG